MTSTTGISTGSVGQNAGASPGPGLGSASAGTGGSSSGDNTRDVAKDEARSVAQDAAESGKATAATAKEQAGQVAGEAANQARQLVDQARNELTSQGSAQKERATTGLRSLADELSGMGQGNQPQGIAGDLVRQASDQVRTAAEWLESHEPGDVLNEARSFARRRPGMFLLSAAAVGFLGGRLTRSLAEETKDNAEAEGASGTIGTTGTTGTVGTTGLTGSAAPLTGGVGFEERSPEAEYADPLGRPAGSLGDELPPESIDTPGYAIPPASDETRGVRGTGTQGGGL